VLVEVFKDEGKTVGSPKQLTVTMFSMIALQLFELQNPIFFLLVHGIEIEVKLVELRFSFKIHRAIFEACTLLVNPSAQLWVEPVTGWHFT
jgi:hypothetical protein